jgi:hypothetical protein
MWAPTVPGYGCCRQARQIGKSPLKIQDCHPITCASLTWMDGRLYLGLGRRSRGGVTVQNRKGGAELFEGKGANRKWVHSLAGMRGTLWTGSTSYEGLGRLNVPMKSWQRLDSGQHFKVYPGKDRVWVFGYRWKAWWYDTKKMSNQVFHRGFAEKQKLPPVGS